MWECGAVIGERKRINKNRNLLQSARKKFDGTRPTSEIWMLRRFEVGKCTRGGSRSKVGPRQAFLWDAPCTCDNVLDSRSHSVRMILGHKVLATPNAVERSP